jgi:O-antigen ligase
MLVFAYAALWLFCFAIPWQNTVVIPGLGTISKLLGILAVGMAVLAALFTGRVRKLDPLHVLMVIFVVYVGFGTYRVTYEELAVFKAATYVQLLMALWMIWELAPHPAQHRRLLFAYVSGAVVAAVATIMAYRGSGGGTRFAAQGFDPNDLGMTLALGIPMAWYLGLVYKNPLLKWASRAYVPLAIVAVGLTASRGAFLATLAALTIVPVAMTKISPGRLVAGVFVLIASVAIAISFIPQASWDRLGTTRAEVQEGTMNSRLLVWQAGFRAFIKAPILGYGTASFPETVSKQIGTRITAHNTFLSVLVEQGLVGFAIFMSMLAVVYRRARALPTLERRWALVQLGTLMVALLPLGWEDAKPLWFILAVITGMGAVAAARKVQAPAPYPVRPGPRQHPAAARRPIIT